MKWIGYFIIAVGAGFLAVICIPLRSSTYRMDAVTGSTQSQTTWLSFIKFQPRIGPTALETRLNKIGFSWKRDWRFLSEVDGSLLSSSHACAKAPPIYEMTPIMNDFVANSSDNQVREFARIMQSGTEVEQNAAVAAAEGRALAGGR